MTSNHECFVYIVPPGQLQFVTAARFRVSKTRTGESIGEFIYGKRYLERSDAVEFDPTELKLSNKTYETTRMEGFFGAIRDAMPDYWGRRVIERTTGKVLLDEFDYLMQGADDRAGALGFGLNVDPPVPTQQFNQTLDLAKLQAIAEAILAHRDLPTNNNAKQVQALLLAGTSMGGARPKAVVEDNKSLWVAKFPTPEDRWNHPCVEHALLKLAKACHLQVADSKVGIVADKEVLLVKRFDRDFVNQEDGNKGYCRHRMVSALTLLKSEDSSAFKASWSYLLLADEIRRISAQPEADLRELYGRMCFNALVSNLDDHPRNHAILAKGMHWRLSPAYDLTPTPSIAQERHLAMNCGNYGRIANKINLLSAHSRFLISKEEAESIIDSMVQTIKMKWEITLRKAGVNAPDCAVLSSAFVHQGFFYEIHS